MANKWMYKIHDFIIAYIEKETAAWLEDDKEVLSELLVETIKAHLTKRIPDEPVYCVVCGTRR